MVQARDILKDALELSETERADIALQLLQSLSPPSTRDDDSWIAEIESRAKRVLAGHSNGSSWEDARRRIEAALAKK